MPDNRRGHVVVSMGGSDPHGLTDKFACLYDIGRRVIVINGPAKENQSVYAASQPGGKSHIEIFPPQENLIKTLMAGALSIIQLGMTAYESMAAGVPPLLVNLSKDHERTSIELERLGCAINLGMWDEFDPV